MGLYVKSPHPLTEVEVYVEDVVASRYSTPLYLGSTKYIAVTPSFADAKVPVFTV